MWLILSLVKVSVIHCYIRPSGVSSHLLNPLFSPHKLYVPAIQFTIETSVNLKQDEGSGEDFVHSEEGESNWGQGKATSFKALASSLNPILTLVGYKALQSIHEDYCTNFTVGMENIIQSIRFVKVHFALMKNLLIGVFWVEERLLPIWKRYPQFCLSYFIKHIREGIQCFF